MTDYHLTKTKRPMEKEEAEQSFSASLERERDLKLVRESEGVYREHDGHHDQKRDVEHNIEQCNS